MLKITIQRPEQIGGQITRISTEEASIIIDLGHNLPNADNDVDPFDDNNEIEKLTKGCDALLYTHYHGDHIGLCQHVPATVPQYIGSVAKEVMLCKYGRLAKVSEEGKKTLESVQRMRTYEANTPMMFGDIKVTPYFVSHSACDSHMFLIEAEGKRILHTGDFRGHGLLSKGLIPTIEKYIKHVDVLITEGTMLARNSEAVPTEHNLGKKAEEWMREFKYVFVHCSSTDMERLAVLNSANKVAHPGGPIVCDYYQKQILGIYSETAGKKSSAFDFGKVYDYKDNNTKLKNLMKNKGFTMFIRSTDKFHDFLNDILPMLNPKQTLFIYSLWEGYINREDTLMPDYVKLRNRFQSADFPAEVRNLHTSGHATMETLRRVCETLNPSTAIIPIHREKGSDFKDTKISPELQEKIVTKDCTLNGIEISFKD